MWIKSERYYDLRFLIMAKLCLLVGVLSIVLQSVYQLKPCSLCLVQRYSFFALALGFVIVHAVRKAARWRVIALLACYLPTLVGVVSSGRQIWLQSLPDHMRPACVPDLSYMVKVFGAYEGVRQFMYSSGGCGKVDFAILGWSLAHYAILFFIFMFTLISIGAFRHSMFEGLRRTPAREI